MIVGSKGASEPATGRDGWVRLDRCAKSCLSQKRSQGGFLEIGHPIAAIPSPEAIVRISIEHRPPLNSWFAG